MKKRILLLTIFLILLVTVIPLVSAGFWDKLFKNIFKSEGKKTTEKQLVKESEEKGGKQIAKQEQITINKVRGQALEDAFKTRWCKKNKCFNTIAEFSKAKLSNGEKAYITNDVEANKFIVSNLNGPSRVYFTRKPDLLEIKYDTKYINGIGGITIYDVKTSAEAVRKDQYNDYVYLCDDLKKWYGNNFCEIKYALPKEEAEELAQKSGDSVLGCLAIGILIAGPDPTDLLCLVG